MAIADLLLGYDGEQTVAIEREEKEIKVGDPVVYMYYRTVKKGILHSSICHDPTCVYVKFNGEDRIALVGKNHVSPVYV